MEFQKLNATHFSCGYLELLGNLTIVGEIDKETWIQQLDEINLHANIEIYVLFNSLENKVVANGTLLIEKKFIHQCGKVGHIEDIVVDPKCQGMGLGKKIVEHLKERAKEVGCYKVILDCDVKNSQFYEKCGFSAKGVEMAYYLM